jgi:hypothetical protein
VKVVDDGIFAKVPDGLGCDQDDKSVSLNVENQVADEIREWAIERQQKLGFDIDYKLTFEGQILEELIDLFYI